MNSQTLNEISLRRLRCWIDLEQEPNSIQTEALVFELGQLGFRIQNIDRFTSTDHQNFSAAINVLSEMRGDIVFYVPLFSGFPDDLPNDGEYLLRRVLGFLGLDTFNDQTKFGADPISQMQRSDLWTTAVAAQSAKLQDSQTAWIDLTIISLIEAEQRLSLWAQNLLYGATPVKEALWPDIYVVIKELNLNIDLNSIQIKESLARIAVHYWQKDATIVVKTPTDLLRMLAAVQKQDISLAKPVSFKGLKLSKPQRRSIVAFLDRCPALAEDLLRYRRLWISLSSWIHPGDLVKQYPRVVQAFDDLRNDRIKSFEAQAINAPIDQRLTKLLERPAMLLRKLTWLLKELPGQSIADAVLSLKDKVADLPLPLLMNVYCALRYAGTRTVINKAGKPYPLDERKVVGDWPVVLAAIDTLIITKLQGSKDWDTVWIDPQLEKLVLPLQARKQSDGLISLGRGSRLPLKNQGVIRIFVYWQESIERTDLDLSVMKLDQDFNYIGEVSWHNYGDGQDIAHSGDIQSAPLGATEFIDLRLTSLETSYVLPAILRFAGESFPDLKTCHAGWMERQDVGSQTQAFDPKTVIEKVQVNLPGRLWIPFLFDLQAQEIIYVDLYTSGSEIIEDNPQFPLLAKGLAQFYQARPTFALLADWYIRANDAQVVDRETANISIGMADDCTINVMKLVGGEIAFF
jgi:hypothetical protein